MLDNLHMPPQNFDLQRLLPEVRCAAEAIAKYDDFLRSMPEHSSLLSVLTNMEAVSSCHLSGLKMPLLDCLKFDADKSHSRMKPEDRNCIEAVLLYRNALPNVTISRTCPEINEKLLRDYFASLNTGQLLRIHPVTRELQTWMDFYKSTYPEPLVQIALLHVDLYKMQIAGLATGRLVRQLTVLLFWHYGLVSRPAFYITPRMCADVHEYHKQVFNSYNLEGVHCFCSYFLRKCTESAEFSLNTGLQLKALYDEIYQQILNNNISTERYARQMLNFCFNKLVFNSTQFTASLDMPRSSSLRVIRHLTDAGIFTELEPGQGSRPGKYVFQRALDIAKKEVGFCADKQQD